MKRDEYKMTQQVDTTDYKQKYEQALKVASQWHKDGIGDVKTIVECIFPELKESEDEKIRIGLIGHLKECRNNTRSEVMLGEYAKWIAWLEKQGEQKSWSKEDERLLNNMVIVIKDYYNKEDAQSLISWLKSLKDKMQPQPKQEWSEEDERAINDIIVTISMYANEEIPYTLPSQLLKDVERLKSIKPNHWKPSEEQIGALNYAYCELFKRGENGEGSNCVHPLMTLIDDLKKL